jgi:hypothetical protein
MKQVTLVAVILAIGFQHPAEAQDHAICHVVVHDNYGQPGRLNFHVNRNAHSRACVLQSGDMISAGPTAEPWRGGYARPSGP